MVHTLNDALHNLGGASTAIYNYNMLNYNMSGTHFHCLATFHLGCRLLPFWPQYGTPVFMLAGSCSIYSWKSKRYTLYIVTLKTNAGRGASKHQANQPAKQWALSQSRSLKKSPRTCQKKTNFLSDFADVEVKKTYNDIRKEYEAGSVGRRHCSNRATFRNQHFDNHSEHKSKSYVENCYRLEE